MTKRILLTGGSGLVGSRVVQLLNQKYDFIIPRPPDFDITVPSSINPVLIPAPDTVVHFAAFTNVNESENQKDLCWQINFQGTKNLLSQINPDKTHFIQISTDMVFSGINGPYKEIDDPAVSKEEITWYGWTKLQAEKLLDLSNSSIVRIIYPVRSQFSRKSDYLRSALKKFDEGKLHPLFFDQQVSITFIDELALALDKIIENKLFGIFHASSPDTGTPHEIISYLLCKARNYSGELTKSSVKKFPPSRYPQKGGLNPAITMARLGIKFSPWREIVDRLIDQDLSTF